MYSCKENKSRNDRFFNKKNNIHQKKFFWKNVLTERKKKVKWYKIVNLILKLFISF